MAIAALPLIAQTPAIAPFRLSDVMAPVPVPERFHDGWSASDPKSGISIRIIQSHTNPRCKSEEASGKASCPWIVEWKSAVKGDMVELRVEASGPNGGTFLSSMPADRKQAAKLVKPQITFPPAAVIYIRVVITAGSGAKAREVASASFE